MICPLLRAASRVAIACLVIGADSALRLRAQEVVAQTVSFAATVHGRVVDSEGGLPLAGVEVQVVDSLAKSTTDAEGYYRLFGLLPGTYSLQFDLSGYARLVVTGVEVGADRDSVDVALQAEEEEVVELAEFTVSGGAPIRNSVTVARKDAQVVVDVLTASDFNRFIATDVSDAIVRMPGLSTTARGSFAVVRGLAERYNPILLDGIVLPSSDPERQTPELDLFPTRVVDAIVVNKVFDPKLPATSTGGAVDLRTKPLPEGRFAQVQFGLRADEPALHGGEFQVSDTPGRWDLLALGSKDRPSAPGTYSETVALTKDVATNWRGEGASFPIGTRIGVVLEDRFDLGRARALGYSFSLGYDSFANSGEGQVYSVDSLPFGAAAVADQNGYLVGDQSGYNYSKYEQEVRIGGLLSLGYAFNQEHTVGLSVFLSQIGAEDVARTHGGFAGLNIATTEQLAMLYAYLDGSDLDPAFGGVRNLVEGFDLSDSIHYRQRNLTTIRAFGEHRWEGRRPVRIEWSVARVFAQQEDPDFSFLGYFELFPLMPGLESEKYQIVYGQPVRLPSRYWRNVSEASWAGRLDGEYRFDLGAIKGLTARAGVYLDATERSFKQESYFLTGGRPSFGRTVADLIEHMQGVDFDAVRRELSPNPARAEQKRDLSSAYLSLVFPLAKDRGWVNDLSLIAGGRFERFQFSVSGRGTLGNAQSADYYLQRSVQEKLPQGSVVIADPLNPYANDFSRDLDESAFYPALSLNWSPSKHTNLRMGYSRTVARPSFREMGPYFTNDEVTDEPQHGNVFLNTSQVENLDFRIEYFFPKSTDLVALSLFKKMIEDPIEKQADKVLGSNFTAIGWFNNPEQAHIAGVEVEAAKNLGFCGEAGSWFTLGGNATFIDAEAIVGSLEWAPVGTKRNLYDQPDWIANAYVTFDRPDWGFSTTVSFFGISDVLRNAAINTWSTYVAAQQRVDLTMNKRFGRNLLVRFTAKNLLDPKREFIADPNVTTERVVLRSYWDGRSFSVSLTWDL